MKYKNIVKAKFISRPNRFIAMVDVNGEKETAHVKNTGRCKELLVDGATVYLCGSDDPKRKTKYDLVTVAKEREGKSSLLINMDSQAPNAIAEEWLPLSGLFSDKAVIKREVFYKSSRFDFYVEDGERKAFIEVKGVTLEDDGVAMFPDAPTERGIKHLCELADAHSHGYEAYVLFIIQMKDIRLFRPNDITHKAFGDTLRDVKKAGVRVLAVDCVVTPNGAVADKFIDTDV